MESKAVFFFMAQLKPTPPLNGVSWSRCINRLNWIVESNPCLAVLHPFHRMYIDMFFFTTTGAICRRGKKRVSEDEDENFRALHAILSLEHVEDEE